MWVDNGLNHVRDFITGDTTSSPTHIGIGKGTTAEVAGDTALTNEVFPTTSRNGITVGYGDNAVSCTMFISTTQINNTTVAEIGLFNQNSGGTMIVRKTQPDLTKKSSHEVITFINLVVLSDVTGGNIFEEDFIDAIFKGTPTTADWDTTNERLYMTSNTSKAQVYNTVATSHSVFYGNGTVTAATLNCDETKYGSDSILYFLSADGGTNWEEVTRGTKHTFNNTGTDLRWKVVFSGNGARDTYIDNLSVRYTV